MWNFGGVVFHPLNITQPTEGELMLSVYDGWRFDLDQLGDILKKHQVNLPKTNILGGENGSWLLITSWGNNYT